MRWLHELYTIADPACTTRVTVPTLWDAKTRRIVNNESSGMIRMFNTAFAGLAEPSPDYYPEPLRPEIDAANALVLKGINNAVNGCGYSISQEAYDGPVKLLFETLDGLEQRLSQQRYCAAKPRPRPTGGCSQVQPYQQPGIAAACDVAGMKRGVFSKAGPVGSNGIIPVGPTVDHSRPHDRGRFAH